MHFKPFDQYYQKADRIRVNSAPVRERGVRADEALRRRVDAGKCRDSLSPDTIFISWDDPRFQRHALLILRLRKRLRLRHGPPIAHCHNRK
jgi:hypothetical protein